MKKLPPLAKYAPTSFLTFMAGLLITGLVKPPISQLLGKYVAAFAILGILFVLFAVGMIIEARVDLKELVRESKLSARVVHTASTENGDAELYDAVTKCLRSATESIQAVSLFRPRTLKSSDARKAYYQALDALLREKKNEYFSYERIIQVDGVVGEELHEENTDALTFAHCQNALERARQTKGMIGLRQTASTLGSLSFFIVDGKQVVFVIPTPPHAASGGDVRALPVGSVVIFSDGEGSLVGEMKNLFASLQLDAKPIRRCVPGKVLAEARA